MKVGFIGLGIMGSRMAKRLVAEGIQLSIYNRSREVYDAFSDEGIIKCDSPQAVVAGCDVVFTMLSTPQVVESLAIGDDGFLHHMKPDSIWIDCSTVNPSFSQLCYERAKDKGVRFMDAPVAGSVEPATNGQLVFLVGGDADRIAEVRPCLDLMGKKVIQTGKVGSGSTLKMLINYSLAHAMVAYGEVLAMGKKMDVPDSLLYELLPELPVVAPFIKLKAPKLKSAKYEVEFPLEWMTKDIALSIKNEDEINIHLPLSRHIHSLFAKGIEKGLAREDFSAIVKVIEADSDQVLSSC